MKVDPPAEIIASVGASISHSGAGPITVTITSDEGDQVTIEVPPNTVVNWRPPAGWESATFNSPGHPELFRLIK